MSWVILCRPQPLAVVEDAAVPWLGYIPVYALLALGQTCFNDGGIIGRADYERRQNTLYA